MKVYVAASWVRRLEMQGIAKQIEEMGITVTSRWLYEHKNMDPSKAAQQDLYDIDSADALVFFAEPSPDNPELAWAAGFWDGEGSATLTQNNNCKTAYVRMTISQIDPYVLERFKMAIGGIGNIRGPFTRKNDEYNRQPQWSFALNVREDVEKVYLALQPYLSPVKLQQFNTCFDGVKTGQRDRPDFRRYSGGRHIEYGYALACGKAIYLIGPKENVFHTLNDRYGIFHFDNFDQFKTAMKVEV